MIRAHRQQFLYESLNNGIVRCKLFEFSGLYIFECKEAKNYQTGSFVLYAMVRRRSSSSIISTWTLDSRIRALISIVGLGAVLSFLAKNKSGKNKSYLSYWTCFWEGSLVGALNFPACGYGFCWLPLDSLVVVEGCDFRLNFQIASWTEWDFCITSKLSLVHRGLCKRSSDDSVKEICSLRCDYVSVRVRPKEDGEVGLRPLRV